MLPAPEAERSRHAVKRALAALDWQEIVTFGFVSSEVERALDPQAVPVKVQNPIAAHLDVMRTSLLPGLIGTLQTNVNRKAARVRVFEVGRVFMRADGVATTDATVKGIHQPMRVAALAWGDAEGSRWQAKAQGTDFFDVRGDVEALLFRIDLG